jgi:glycerophosphoryl diester phosphodiesterase
MMMSTPTSDRPLVIAHRGASAEAPENSLSAFVLAEQVGADAIELDVHLTADGAMVVMHDDTVDATTNGHGAIAKMTLEQVRQLRLRPRKGSLPAQPEPPPTLNEVIEQFRGHLVLINVEIKLSKTPELAEAVARLIEQSGAVEQVLISSFDTAVLTYLQDRHAALRRALLFPPSAMSGLMAGTGWITGAALMGCEAIHPHWRLASLRAVERAHELGLNVNAWTLDDQATVRRLAAQGIDGVITNDPRGVRTALSAAPSR